MSDRPLYYVENVFILSVNGVLYDIREPIGWDKVLINIKFDEKLGGYKYEFTKGEILLTFSEACGSVPLDDEYERAGGDGVANLKFGEIDPGGVLTIHFEADVNFNDYKEDDKGRILLNVERRGFGRRFESRFDTEVNLLAAETLDGKPLTPLAPQDTVFHPKLILLEGESLYDKSIAPLNAGFDMVQDIVPPFKILCNDVAGFQNVSPSGVIYSLTDLPDGIDKGLLSFDVTLSFDMTITTSNFAFIRITALLNGTDLIKTQDLGSYGPSASPTLFNVNVGFPFQSDVGSGDFIVLQVGVRSTGSLTVHSIEWTDLDAGNSITVKDRTTYPMTVVGGYTLFDVVNRQLEIITDKIGVLKSDFLETGCASNNIILNGKLLRKLENPDFKISMKDTWEALSGIWDLVLTFERDNDLNEFIRIEQRDLVNNDTELHNFGTNISGYKKEADTNRIYNELEFGFSKWPDDNEKRTLDEWMTVKKYLTPIKTNKKKYKVKIPWVLSSYYIEFTRRQAVVVKETSQVCQSDMRKNSYKTDDDVFMITVQENKKSAFTGFDCTFVDADNTIKVTNDWYMPTVPGDLIEITGTTSNNGVKNVIGVVVDILDNSILITTDGGINDETTTGVGVEVVQGSFPTYFGLPRWIPKRDEDFQLLDGIITGLVGDDSSYNLEHTLKRILFRHSRNFGSAFHYLQESEGSAQIKFLSGVNNSEIVTQFGSNRTDCFFGDDDVSKDILRDSNDELINSFSIYDGKHFDKPNIIEFKSAVSWDMINFWRKAYENRSPNGNDNFGYWSWIRPKDGVTETGRLIEIEFPPNSQLCTFKFRERNPA